MLSVSDSHFAAKSARLDTTEVSDSVKRSITGSISDAARDGSERSRSSHKLPKSRFNRSMTCRACVDRSLSFQGVGRARGR